MTVFVLWRATKRGEAMSFFLVHSSGMQGLGLGLVAAAPAEQTVVGRRRPWNSAGIKGSPRRTNTVQISGRPDSINETARFARRKRKRVAWAQRANPFWVHEAESSGSAHGLTHHSSAPGHSRVVKKIRLWMITKASFRLQSFAIRTL